MLKTVVSRRWSLLRLVLVAVYFFLGFSHVGLSQMSDIKPPKPPFVEEDGMASGHWVVDFKYGDSSVGSRSTATYLDGKRLMRVETRKVGGVKTENITFEGGASQETWSRGGVMGLKVSGVEGVVSRFPNNAGKDFPELFWINEANFKAREDVDGVDCYVFESMLYPMELANPGLFQNEMAQSVRTIDLGEKVPVISYVNVENKRPVKLVAGKDTRLYTYLLPPTGDLIIPAEYAEAIAKVESRYRAVNERLSAP